ncbi:MAG: prephenate dehydratase [Planctomycetota bacterium]|nr:prephenate dehydratase [Planctomycetota bacterium]
MAKRAKTSKAPNGKSSGKSGGPKKPARAVKGVKVETGPSPSAGQLRAGIDLAQIRARINDIDKKLVKILNERASLVVEVGKYKRAAGLPVYAPHREAEVLDRAIQSNTGPLPDRSLEAIYRELMSGSFTLQQPLRVGYLGPPGSYSHLAAVKQFGKSVEFEDLHEIAGVFTEVQRGHVNYGLVPIENSTHGGVAETLDSFLNLRGEVTICAEVQLEVHHALLANCSPKQIRRIHSKPEVFSQCRNWLATQFPGAELVPAASSSRAAKTAFEEHQTAMSIGAEPGSAAIGSELAGQIYGLKVLFERIEDNPNNLTRFFVIGRQKVDASGDDKTSIMFNTQDKPGALVHVLQVFERAGINLSHIDKRPSGRTNWTYTFFIDAQGHVSSPSMAAAIEEARTHCQELVVMGSYPRSKRIL